jgi:hypothetical protein
MAERGTARLTSTYTIVNVKCEYYDGKAMCETDINAKMREDKEMKKERKGSKD